MDEVLVIGQGAVGHSIAIGLGRLGMGHISVPDIVTRRSIGRLERAVAMASEQLRWGDLVPMPRPGLPLVSVRVPEAGRYPLDDVYSLGALVFGTLTSPPPRVPWRSSIETIRCRLDALHHRADAFGSIHVLNGADGDRVVLSTATDEDGPPLRLITTRPILRTGPPPPATTTGPFTRAAHAA